MAPRLFANYRNLGLFRKMDNPASAGNTGAVDGAPLVGCVDQFGVQWVRLFTGGAFGIAAGQLPSTRQASSNPGAGVQATASLAASGGVHVASNVPTLLSWSFGDTAAVAAPLTLVLRDGASGVGPILWQKRLGPLLAGTFTEGNIIIPVGQGIPGSGNTAMTLEFTAAPAATGFQTVDIQGYYAS